MRILLMLFSIIHSAPLKQIFYLPLIIKSLVMILKLHQQSHSQKTKMWQFNPRTNNRDKSGDTTKIQKPDKRRDTTLIHRQRKRTRRPSNKNKTLKLVPLKKSVQR